MGILLHEECAIASAHTEQTVVEETVATFVAYLERRKVRLSTRKTYARELRLFARALGTAPTITDVTTEAIEAYYARIGHLAGATIAKKLTAIRIWCRWCIKTKLRVDDPTLTVEWPRHMKRLPRPLSSGDLEALEKMLAAPLTCLNKRARWTRQRDRRIVLLMLYGGFRRTELAGLRWPDIDLRGRTALVRAENAKGGHERMVPLHERVIAELKRTPPQERIGAVAGRRDGRCLSGSGVYHVFERWLGELGISPHRLRHTMATESLRAGANIRQIQSTLGHRDIRTTEGYIELLAEEQIAAIDKLPKRFGSAPGARRKVRRKRVKE